MTCHIERASRTATLALARTSNFKSRVGSFLRSNKLSTAPRVKYFDLNDCQSRCEKADPIESAKRSLAT